MRLAATIAGVVLIVVGIIWILQGVNVLPGSFMTGQIGWAIAGVVALLVGAVALAYGRRRAA